MLKFKYKDMRVRYHFMLALASLNLLNAVLLNIQTILTAAPSMHFSLVLNSFVAIPALILICIALRALRYKVEFTDDAVVLNSTRIELAQVDRIKFNEEELSYTVEYGYTKSRKVTMGRRESDEDIGTFRQAMREMITRVKQANPSAKISQDTVNSTTPGTKVYAQADQSIREEKAKLTGIGGWLLYIFFDLLIVCISHISSIYLKHTAISNIGTIGILLYYIFIASTMLFEVFALVLLCMRKKMFQKVFIVFLAYQIVAERVILALQYSLIDRKWPGTIGIINGFAIGVIASIIWIFAWKAYFQRSIRVRNTFR